MPARLLGAQRVATPSFRVMQTSMDSSTGRTSLFGTRTNSPSWLLGAEATIALTALWMAKTLLSGTATSSSQHCQLSLQLTLPPRSVMSMATIQTAQFVGLAVIPLVGDCDRCSYRRSLWLAGRPLTWSPVEISCSATSSVQTNSDKPGWKNYTKTKSTMKS